MTHTNPIQALSDDQLLHALSELVQRSRRVEADLVAHIGEVDHRRLYARAACSSMFSYSLEVMHLSEHEAYERITAARASRKYPMLLEMLRDGRLHLSGIGKLAPHLTEENCERLLARAAHKTKRQIEELLVEISPKPDVPPVIRKLPERSAKTPPQKPPRTPPQTPIELRPDRAMSPAEDPVSSHPPLPPPARPVVEPLSPSRYKIAFTASAELREKLEQLQALTQSDLAAVIETAVTEKLERLEAKRYGETKSPRKTLDETDTSPKSRYMPAAVRRIVRKRDCRQCTFVDEGGRRCTERRWLEFHHDDPYGRGGDHDPSRIRLLCKVHNLLLAERDYGKEVINKYRRMGSRVSEPAAFYGFIEPCDVREWSAIGS
jgi:hypothetical protein